MPKRRVEFLVTLDVPLGCTIARMRDYIETEVKAGVGGVYPEDPITDLDRNSVVVIRHRQRKKATEG